MKISAAYFLLLTAIIFNSLTGVFFKFSSLNNNDRTKAILFFIVGLVFGFINTIFYTKSLKTINLNVAYPIFSGGSMVILTIVSYLFFKESFTAIKTAGLFLIIFGIYLVSK